MKTTISIVFLLLVAGGLSQQCASEPQKTQHKERMMTATENLDTATLAGGCFWCIEAVFQQLNGVMLVKSGYTGGEVVNPTYDAVCSGSTGHAEAIQIVYDPTKVSFAKLLEVFFTVHDPTTLNRQGADAGTQYRSAVFYHSDDQRKMAETVIAKLNSSGTWTNPIVTEIKPVKPFYVAEKYHQNYFNDNKQQPYCRMVIQPKMEKFQKVFKEIIK
ncbi:peptide-methionine (S)-S-oxide reductase MsrA [Williamwhitmania taraxaci]|uniref:Peptide methionine sulfoxide reductase MsrA n=1 Tax=Williamwhitmania taraxaci TaxID=1640674 RepID=A0A1G6R5E5_9BACT|nr:peptide-methionine (S)-S-oxide reductase MsrA [Williamwhitmania taraxaci]SDC99768.1 peptide-methionine (S)-S-oxide reductase [Williamwhitmania taraxaci]